MRSKIDANTSASRVAANLKAQWEGLNDSFVGASRAFAAPLQLVG